MPNNVQVCLMSPHPHTHTHTHTHTHIYIYIKAFIQMRIHKNLYIYIYVYNRHICVYIYIYIYIYIFTHTHARAPPPHIYIYIFGVIFVLFFSTRPVSQWVGDCRNLIYLFYLAVCWKFLSIHWHCKHLTNDVPFFPFLFFFFFFFFLLPKWSCSYRGNALAHRKISWINSPASLNILIDEIPSRQKSIAIVNHQLTSVKETSLILSV